ncbi:hypothetical protein BDP27DRAFT_1335484 [Rhodocollybia butyracea]|uniref:Uncharacterized protein n=1 Tax=Rhodocollybia butyracea TaxID=206335 RepID=A0A9P5PJI5_9AGAR|nr:hypothetical protein BDP27DRAFT_1335484 [Rhodocollybia butyracea]
MTLMLYHSSVDKRTRKGLSTSSTDWSSCNWRRIASRSPLWTLSLRVGSSILSNPGSASIFLVRKRHVNDDDNTRA